MSTHQHDRDHPHHQSHGTAPPPEAPASRAKPIVIVGVILMLVALLAYVLTVDESIAPGEQGEQMPAAD